MCLEKIQNAIKLSRSQPVYMRLAGNPGTGKTFMLSIFSDQVKKAGLKYCVATNTGKNACNLNGMTIHRLLGWYDCKKSFQTLINMPFTRATAQQIKSINFLLLDEIGLIGAYFLNAINHRMQLIRNSSLPFGGASVIFSEDLSQLSCVKDIPLSRDPASVEDSFAREGLLFFQQQTDKFVLTDQVRQKHDERFSLLLTNLRNHCLTKNDIELLIARHEKNVSLNDFQTFNSAPIVFATNDQVDYHNIEVILSKNIPVKKVEPEFNVDCQTCKKQYKSCFVGPNIKLQIVRNLAYSLGVANGSNAVCKDVVFDIQSKLPLFIIANVESFKGKFLPDTENCIPIPVISERFFCSHLQQYINVKFLPVMNRECVTFYKLQGETIPKLKISLDGITKYSRELYVAVSRVEKITNLLFQSSKSVEIFFQ